jgi:hypothetical protein
MKRERLALGFEKMADGFSDSVEGAQPLGAEVEIPFWRAPWEFAVHGVVGTLIFAIIAALAVALDLAVGWLESIHRVSDLVIIGLKVAEWGLFVTDLFLFGMFLWRTAKRTLKNL